MEEYGNAVKLSVERFFVLLICRYGTHVEFTIVNLCVMCGCYKNSRNDCIDLSVLEKNLKIDRNV